jgi:hypothetical protein
MKETRVMKKIHEKFSPCSCFLEPWSLATVGNDPVTTDVLFSIKTPVSFSSQKKNIPKEKYLYDSQTVHAPLDAARLRRNFVHEQIPTKQLNRLN